MTIIWFSIILIYFGITLHMSTLGGDVYINTVKLRGFLFVGFCWADQDEMRVEKFGVI
jgi:MFS transporter, OCT family, solute carrier family 22 (organic cation transporter), member 4/5